MTFFNYLVPLTNIPQTFVTNLAGINYTLTVKWNDIAESWYLDIADQNQVPIACGIPFITGESLLAQLAYLGIQGDFFVFTNGNSNAVPTLDNLGTASNLYFQTTVVNNGG